MLALAFAFRADMIIGGRITKPLQKRARKYRCIPNIKGFAFEYMTNGRALVLGDPIHGFALA